MSSGETLAWAMAAFADSTARSVAVKSLRLPPKVPNAVRLPERNQISSVLEMLFISFTSARLAGPEPSQDSQGFTTASVRDFPSLRPQDLKHPRSVLLDGGYQPTLLLQGLDDRAWLLRAKSSPAWQMLDLAV